MASVRQAASIPRANRRGFGKNRSAVRREARWGYIFIAPWLVGLVIFWVGPLLAVFYYSLTDYPILSHPTWIGLANYRAMVTDDPKFVTSLVNTAIYVAFRVPIHLTLAFGLALLLKRSVRGIGVFRTLIYIPSMVPAVALAVIFRILLDPRIGYVNYLADLIHFPQYNYLTSAAWIKPVIIFISLFQVGIAMIIFLAGLANVPEELYEAAKIDGASPWQQFMHITIPMMTPVILFNVVIDIIASFQVFTYALILTDGGPNDSSLFYVLYIYRQAFKFFRMGYASALAVVLFVIILVFTVILMKSSDRWVRYERV